MIDVRWLCTSPATEQTRLCGPAAGLSNPRAADASAAHSATLGGPSARGVTWPTKVGWSLKGERATGRVALPSVRTTIENEADSVVTALASAAGLPSEPPSPLLTPPAAFTARDAPGLFGGLP